MNPHTFLWHDYETFGAIPRRDRPAQFAAIRTDAELNEIGEPIMLYCQPANDFLPDPVSCLITGITPQHCLQHGVPEHEFATVIEKAFSEPGTIGVGYNTIRFDDEITRFMFWRNLIDPYAREWKNQCGRWDILDVVRTAFALRPDGIQWPTNEDGRPSFRLEHLAAANHLVHEAAHDALSDVRATIALARLIRQKQPRLFDFCLALHKKERAATEVGFNLSPELRRPFLHISGMFPVERGCLALMWPLAQHPGNKNEIIAWNLSYNPAELASLDAETIRTRLFTRTDDLPEGVVRLPVKSVHLNKSPMVFNNLKILSPEQAEHWHLDLAQALEHAQIAQTLPARDALWQQVYLREAGQAVDVDEDLYGGFVGNQDRRQLDSLRQLTPSQLASKKPTFEDPRLEELLFRYRARNFPETLNPSEKERWLAHRLARMSSGQDGARTLAQLQDELQHLPQEPALRRAEIIQALSEYAQTMALSLNITS